MQKRTRSERVPLPAGVTPGSIIGPKGAIVTEIRRSTGASVAVKDTYVVVTGSPSAVKSAIDRLLALFRTAQVKGAKPWIPKDSVYLLDAAFGSRPQDLVEALPADEEVCQATDKPQSMYNLAPAASGTAAQADADALADVMAAGAQLAQASPSADSPFLLAAAGGEQAAVSRLVAAISKACSSGGPQPYDELKLRLNLGQALFFKGLVAGQRLSLGQLMARHVPRNLGSVFSNGLPAARATTMPQRLEAALPFLVLVDVKDTLSLHLKHQQASDQYYALSMVEQPGSVALELRKVKTNAHKLFSLSSVAGSAEAEDMRLKLIGLYHSSAGGSPDAGLDPGLSSQLAEVAQHCCLAGPCRLAPSSLAAMQALGYELDNARFKSKRRYQGSLQLPSGATVTLKVSINTVSSALSCSGGTSGRAHAHTEVTGSCPDLNELLQQALESVGGGQQQGLSSTQRGFVEDVVLGLLGLGRRVGQAVP